nr:bacteriohemerythrin [uncultured Desulfobulbus sp.]
MRSVNKWDDNLSVGIGLIDNQHKIIFDLLGDLGKASAARADKKVVDTLFDVLENYVFRHFEAEEELIASHRDVQSHSLEHYNLVKRFHKFRLGFRNGTSCGSTVDEFLETWFVRHISEHDKPLFTQIANGELTAETKSVDAYPYPHEERRRHKRIPHKKITNSSIVASCYNTSSLKSSQVEVVDISLGGLRFLAHHAHQPGDLLVLGCTLGKHFKMKEKIRVANVSDTSVGAEFVNLSPATEKFLMELYGAVNLRNY